MVKKAEEKKDAPVAQADSNMQATPDAATPGTGAPAAGENGDAAALGQEDDKNAAKADAAEGGTPWPRPRAICPRITRPNRMKRRPSRLWRPCPCLACCHHVTSWPQAALMRCMGWESGKLVTDAEYRAALTCIKNRPMGGGRLAEGGDQ